MGAETTDVLRVFEEDVKDKDVFDSTTMTAPMRMLLSQATDLRNEDCTVFTADVKTAFLNAHIKDGDVVYARPPPESQPETLDLWTDTPTAHHIFSCTVVSPTFLPVVRVYSHTLTSMHLHGSSTLSECRP